MGNALRYARTARSLMTTLSAIISALWKLHQQTRPDQTEAWFETEVVGESYRKNVLREIYGGRAEGKKYFDARLEPDPANPHDPNAVRVLIAGRHVGYLPRHSARRYVRKHAAHPHDCRAVIVTRKGGHGVWLDFTV